MTARTRAICLGKRSTVDQLRSCSGAQMSIRNHRRPPSNPLCVNCRAGLKLDAALEHFGLDVSGLTALDAGLSTGGFADCLLQRGAARVFGVDVGNAQVDTC